MLQAVKTVKKLDLQRLKNYQSEEKRTVNELANTNPEPCQVVLDRAHKN